MSKKTPDEIRRELDGGPNVVELRPGHERPARRLATVWADEVAIDLGGGGLVDGLLPGVGMTVLYGESGAGKTFAAIDLAGHVAAGLPWHGMDVEQGVVVYVAAEAPDSVKRRLWAWKQRHGVGSLPVLVVQSTVDLLDGDADELAGLVEQVARDHGHGRVALVVVDTLARSMAGNENAPDDMGRFVAACATIREAAGGTHVLVVHHSGKDAARGARGHSCLRAATDTELEVTKAGEDGTGCVAVTKSRDEPGASRFGFKLEAVDLGTNAKGRIVTTCVAVMADVTARQAKERAPRRLSDKGRIVAQAVETALRYEPQPPPAHPETGGVAQGVTVKTARLYWRQLLGWDHLSETERDHSRQDWKRGVENALAAGALKQWGERLWLRP
jgi:KaiC/GvpD/RAD55 family RecA-like ATPase